MLIVASGAGGVLLRGFLCGYPLHRRFNSGLLRVVLRAIGFLFQRLFLLAQLGLAFRFEAGETEDAIVDAYRAWYQTRADEAGVDRDDLGAWAPVVRTVNVAPKPERP